MPEINGKIVILKDVLEASEWWPLMPALSKMAGQDGASILATLDWPTVCAMVKGAVKSWEFDGEPHNAKDVGKLDTFSEMIPLLRMISKLVGEKASGLGESDSEST